MIYESDGFLDIRIINSTMSNETGSDLGYQQTQTHITLTHTAKAKLVKYSVEMKRQLFLC